MNMRLHSNKVQLSVSTHACVFWDCFWKTIIISGLWHVVIDLEIILTAGGFAGKLILYRLDILQNFRNTFCQHKWIKKVLFFESMCFFCWGFVAAMKYNDWSVGESTSDMNNFVNFTNIVPFIILSTVIPYYDFWADRLSYPTCI